MSTTRQARKAQTRERLLGAAGTVFARRGYHRALLEEAAEEAGFSTGAVCSNFDGKEDLFLTLLEELVERPSADLARAVAGGATVAARTEEGARMFTGLLARGPELFLLFVEFWAQAVRELGVERPGPVRELAIAIDALADGFALQKPADPDAIKDDLLGRLIGLLLRGAGVDIGPAG